MKQVFRRVIDRKGRVVIEEIPRPHCGPDQVLVETAFTLISSGTEMATLKKTPLELTRQVLEDPWMRNAVKDLVTQGGVRQAANRVWDELHLLRVIGYSGSGIAVEVGENVSGIEPGDPLAFAAQGHAEIVAPAKNHVVKVPPGVSLRDAAFLTVGGIAIQGVRRADVELGHRVAVLGLGLVGQLVTSILRAAGCRVIGIDINGGRVEKCQALGAEFGIDASVADPVRVVREITGGHGADRTIICAASQDPGVANQAMEMTRKQGRVVSVGLVKMELERLPFFLRELDFVFSRAYGPGSYDPAYEKGRIDYPFHYVRWTEQRNLEEFLRLVRDGLVSVDRLIERVLPFEQAQEAYSQIAGGQVDAAMVLAFGGETEAKMRRTIPRKRRPSKDGQIGLGMIGAGNFSRGTLMPILASLKGCRLRAVCSRNGVTATAAGKRYGVDYVTSDVDEVLGDDQVDAVIVATRHDAHADLVARAARAGKHVFVEKPFALEEEAMQRALTAVREAGVRLMVGYNRRYSGLAERVRRALPPGPRTLHYLTCIPPVPSEHWTLDTVEGGGRLIGEAEHFFDLANSLISASPQEVFAQAAGEDEPDHSTNFTVSVRYADGSLAQFLYTSRGSADYPRETVQVFCGGVTAIITDWSKLRLLGRRRLRPVLGADLGHRRELEVFLAALRSEDPWDGLSIAAQASAISLAAGKSWREGRPVAVSEVLPAGWSGS